MRSLRFQLLFFTLAPLAMGSSEARADWLPYSETVYLETAYTSPASAAYAVPTSYYATAYYPDAYTWTPTAYSQTAYVPTGYYYQERVARRALPRRGLFGRRRDYLVPTTVYYPTSMVMPTTSRYYAPTVLQYPVLSDVRYQVASNACGTCDDSVVTTSSMAPARVEQRVVRDQVAAPRAEQPTKQQPVESESLDEPPTTSSNVPPPPAGPDPEPPTDLKSVDIPRPTKSQPDNVSSLGTQTAKDSPPAAPVAPSAESPAPATGTIRKSAPRQTEQPKVNTTTGSPSIGAEKKVQTPAPVLSPKQEPASSPADIGLPPVAPADPGDTDVPAGPDVPALPKNSQSMKPVYELARPAGLTLLKGRVQSSASSNPEGGVQITVSSRTNAFQDRTASTNVTGRFSLKVPDGDWTVKVTMPSGRVYPVYQITVSGGAIIDDQGQEVPALVITR